MADQPSEIHLCPKSQSVCRSVIAFLDLDSTKTIESVYDAEEALESLGEEIGH